MPTHNSNDLIERLLDNSLSAGELDAFLVGLYDSRRTLAYSDALETHFNKLLLGTGSLPEGFTDRPEKPPTSSTDERRESTD